MASITTIADELGISPSTVSRALQRPQMVSVKTRHAVLQTAKKQGYLDKLNKDKGRPALEPLIGVLVADLSNSFSDLIVKSVQDQAYLRNYSVVVGCTYEQPAFEKQILKLMTEGYSNMEIAQLLVISINTTKAHVASILQKLEVDDRLQAALKALKNNIV